MNEITFDEFNLAWRFNDAEKYALLSKEELDRFKPLNESTSHRLWEQYVYPDSGDEYNHLQKLFVFQKIPCTPICRFHSISELEEQGVSEKLTAKFSVAGTDNILFFWGASCVVKTDWSLFLRYWDDFCYPSDDTNVLIIPKYDKALIYIEDHWSIFNRPNGTKLFGQK